MIKITANDVMTAHRLAVQTMLHEAPRSDDPELLCESFIILEMGTSSGLNSWRQDSSILEKATEHVLSTTDLADRMREHYSERVSERKICKVVELLKSKPHSKKAIIQIWEEGDIDRGNGSACIMYIWFRQDKDVLHSNVHIRASDVFKKLLANLIIVSQIHHEISKNLGLGVGMLRFVSDCGHLYKTDRQDIETFLVGN